jgi:hypothetical protein
MIVGLLWIALAIFLLHSGFGRIGISMLLPIATPFLFWNWCHKKWRKQSTDDFS